MSRLDLAVRVSGRNENGKWMGECLHTPPEPRHPAPTNEPEVVPLPILQPERTEGLDWEPPKEVLWIGNPFTHFVSSAGQASDLCATALNSVTAIKRI